MFPSTRGNTWTEWLPAERRNLTHTVWLGGTCQARIPPALPESWPKGKPMGMRAKDDGKSERRPVMGMDRDWNMIPRESELTSIGFLITREFTELLKEEIANERASVCIIRQGDGLERHWLEKSRSLCQKAANAYREGSKSRPLFLMYYRLELTENLRRS